MVFDLVFKYALIPLRTYFQTPIFLWCSSWYAVLVLNFQPNRGRIYLQRVWSISLRMYLGWTCQLTHSNKYISFEYFESIVAPSTVLNRRIFLTTFFCLSWFSFYCQYCHQHTTFARSLHYFIIFDTCSNCVDRDCAQRKSESSKKTVTILSQFKLGLLPKEIIWYMVGTIPSHIRLSSNVKY